jgi:hypothetical protein
MKNITDNSAPRCAALACQQAPDYQVWLSDDCPGVGRYDEIVGYLCHTHARENQGGSVGIPAHGSFIKYPYLKKHGRGYLRYKDLSKGRFLREDGCFGCPALNRPRKAAQKA